MHISDLLDENKQFRRDKHRNERKVTLYPFFRPPFALNNLNAHTPIFLLLSFSFLTRCYLAREKKQITSLIRRSSFVDSGFSAQLPRPQTQSHSRATSNLTISQEREVRPYASTNHLRAGSEVNPHLYAEKAAYTLDLHSTDKSKH